MEQFKNEKQEETVVLNAFRIKKSAREIIKNEGAKEHRKLNQQCAHILEEWALSGKNKK